MFLPVYSTGKINPSCLRITLIPTGSWIQHLFRSAGFGKLVEGRKQENAPERKRKCTLGKRSGGIIYVHMRFSLDRLKLLPAVPTKFPFKRNNIGLSKQQTTFCFSAQLFRQSRSRLQSCDPGCDFVRSTLL